MYRFPLRRPRPRGSVLASVSRLLPLLFFSGCLGSCIFKPYKEPVGFRYSGPEGERVLYGLSPAAVSGKLPLVPGNAQSPASRYVFDPPLTVPHDYSLELSYAFQEPGPDLARPRRVALEFPGGGASWELPAGASFLGVQDRPAEIRYAVPVPEGIIGEFSLAVFPAEQDQGASAASGAFELNALRLIPRWYGFYWDGPVLALTPFVFTRGGAGSALHIDPPAQYRIQTPVELQCRGKALPLTIQTGNLAVEYRVPGAPGDAAQYILPQGVLPGEPYPLILSPAGPFASVILAPAPQWSFPVEPVPADPGLVLVYPRSAWRDDRYEVFRWSAFPQILIFDTRDYAVQDRLFKRLAFFVEKAGYRGRLVRDQELEGLHGWNAHDYRAEDLGRFFEAARASNFPLLPEERELEDILARNGILRRGPGPAGEGETLPGTGALIAISQQSPGYLRRQFMAHEGFHGIFFIDQDFQDFSRRRWEGLDKGAKRFLISFFDSQRYDVKDPYLMANEFMAYCLQQPVSQAGAYFGENLAGRINENSWRRAVLPPMDEDTKTWPGLARTFTQEARAFSEYVNRRWGLAAGMPAMVQARRTSD